MKKLLICLLALTSMTAFAVDNHALCSSEQKDIGLTKAVDWYRNSAEKKALYNQAFFVGSQYVENWVRKNHPAKLSWGVILDIDETTLDNSWYFHKCGEVANNEADFSHYVSNQQKSIAQPGVVGFIDIVHRLGGYVTLLSNRDGSFKDETGSVLEKTIANLKQQGVYFDQVVLANRRDSKNPGDKNPRFNAVITGNYIAKQMVWSNKLPPHKVIAYFGDNIQDFPELKQAKMNSLNSNNSDFNKFGNGYFILPNPMYGSWENNKNN